MEIKDTLKKPYTDKAKADFIVENNHQKGYEIRETDTELQAWGYDENEQFEQAKTAKLEELSRISHQYSAYDCPVDMYIVSSTGFKVDADVCSQTNMQGLVLMLEPGQTTQYKDFYNEFQEVSREQLETMIVECKQNGLNLYQQKFEYEAQINAAQTIEELDAIELVFEMMDFTEGDK